MADLLNTKAAQVAAGILALGILAIGLALWVAFGLYLGWLLTIEITALAILLPTALAVAIMRKARAPIVVYDTDKKEARMIDGVLVPHKTYPASLTSLTPHYDPRIIAPAALPAPVVEATPLPTARSIYEAMPSGRDGRILLGYDGNGPCWLEVDELLSIAMAGNSGRGKSNALVWLVLQFIRQGIQTVILDGKGDLRRWIGSYHPVSYTPLELTNVVRWLLLEGKRRLEEASVQAGAAPDPLLVVVDELDLVESRAPDAVSLVELLTKKTRSVNMHGIYSNQSIPADLVGGVQTRGVIASRICFYCDDEAARLIGVRANNGAATLLQRIAPPEPPGLALARTVAFGWKLIAIPEVPEPAVSWLLQGMPPLPPLPMKVSLSAEMPAQTPLSAVEEERERIRDAIAQHPTWSNAAIAQALGYRNNNKLSLIKAIREEGNT